ncbi:uncharacterized protein DFE_2576 [Desulfovibrio ferrophilus]|uniref:Uncharacterized protein n=1 Tax=Desulfovibrio ferrophilus TaxID=241368 RepID=A0A2Z6B1B2_9BACT|nr:uncharacterized protein DFE_2576 [Desulfovibrio ferrophilus]
MFRSGNGFRGCGKQSDAFLGDAEQLQAEQANALVCITSCLFLLLRPVGGDKGLRICQELLGQVGGVASLEIDAVLGRLFLMHIDI